MSSNLFNRKPILVGYGNYGQHGANEYILGTARGPIKGIKVSVMFFVNIQKQKLLSLMNITQVKSVHIVQLMLFFTKIGFILKFVVYVRMSRN